MGGFLLILLAHTEANLCGSSLTLYSPLYTFRQSANSYVKEKEELGHVEARESSQCSLLIFTLINLFTNPSPPFFVFYHLPLFSPLKC